MGFSEEFVYGISQIDKNEIHYTSLSDINIKLNDNLYVDQSILSIDKIDAIHKLYVQAEDNTLKYYQDIKDRYADILKEIKSGTELIIVDGCAGSGKTALSFKLYFKSDLDINFLIMNEKFYYALGMEKHFKKPNFITFGTDFLVLNTDEQIVVIDEAQRLNKERLIEIMEKSPCVIWLGDFTQSFSIKENVESVEDLKKIAEQLNKTTKVFKLKKSKRYPNAVERAINYLVGINTNKDSLYKLLEYEINIYTNEKQFYEDLIRKKGKVFTPNHFAFKEENKEIKINGEKFIKAERDYVSFPINTNEYSYYGYTLNAYSFDVRHNFIYLYDLCIDKKNGFIIPKDKKSNSLSYKEKFQNELYTLFTRGKESLNIFVQDIDVYLHLNKNLRVIKNASKIE